MELSVSELAALFFNKYPAITTAARNNVESIFHRVDKEELITEEIAEDILQQIHVREIARIIAQEAIDVVNGSTTSLSLLSASCEKHLRGEDLGNSDSVPVTNDLDNILAGVTNNIKWLFNIPTLQRVVPGIGPALLMLIAMRPEGGKTALHTHLTAAPQGFAWQGAKVDIIINEEPAIRTKMRSVCSATGFTEQGVREKLDEAKVVWDQIKDRINHYDCVGMTLEGLDAHVAASKSDIFIIDQLDKIHPNNTKDKPSHELLREIYTGAREIGKRYQKAIVGISQLSADADNRRNVDFSMMENSKTGKAAEADLIICGGHINGEEFRQLNVTKNKITGDHSPVTVRLDPLTSRYFV